MKAEDVVAKHLESIGTEAARVGVRSLVAVGTTRAVFKARNDSGALSGRVVFASEGNKVLLGMAFDLANYPSEKFGYDGKKFTVGYLKPGIRSTLGSFVLLHDEIFKEGLMGGSLSSAWPLLKLAERKAKVEYAGTDKIGELPVYKLKYYPNKGSDLRISLFFDAKTFQHVRTQYDKVTGARLGAGGVDNQASQRAARFRLTEDYGDFKQEDKLTVPHSYKLHLETEATAGNSSYKWEMTLGQFAFNEPINENSFNVEAD
ncbi:MAG: hypothetical protein H7Z38_17300 [Rubrivivax sp.]|nr:hypothetical protein [Pyrinomonadaceae bacterium]